MKASGNDVNAEAMVDSTTGPATTLASGLSPADDVDAALLDDSLAKTPWERMQANDDALRFAESLRAAMEKRNAESKRTNAPTC